MPYLVISRSFKDYTVFPLKEGTTAIGRHPENQLVLEGEGTSLVSRHHADIVGDDKGFRLLDCSRNGTMVANRPIKKLRLQGGTTFQIPPFQLSFVDDDLHGNDPLAEDNENNETCFAPEPPALEVADRLAQCGIIAQSKALLAMYEDLLQVAAINVPTFIDGEAGSGKEKVAQALHHFSGVSGPFVALNCSAIPEGIFESELFGSVKGAFSHATDKAGKLEQAHNGTLLLDEIGDMDLALQPKLLRFLEDKKISRLGESRERQLNVRLVAATNQDIPALIDKRLFRDDLYQRLACIKLSVPPLRQRRQDILPLAEFFLQGFRREHDLPVRQLSEESQETLLGYSWPGNVRELRNVLLSAAIRCREPVLEKEQLAAICTASEQPETAGADDLSLKAMERQHIERVLIKVEGNKAQAAKLLGITRDTLYKKMARYQL